MKRMASIFLVFVVMCLGMGLVGCTRSEGDLPIGRLPEYESGFFRYAVDTLPSGTQKAYWVGLTELGKQQTELIYPETIDDYTVYGIGYEYSTGVMSVWVGEIRNENLQKVYMPKLPKEHVRSFLTKKAILWDISYGYEKVKMLPYIEHTIKTYGYNIFMRESELLVRQHLSFTIANVSYLYNYEDTPNDGYYWVDTYNESLITFIPPEPTRESYTFAGWYKEAECINAWDFDSDITGKEINIDRETVYESYDGIYLYAKWVANNV